jgi:hypothetical protein
MDETRSTGPQQTGPSAPEGWGIEMQMALFSSLVVGVLLAVLYPRLQLPLAALFLPCYVALIARPVTPRLRLLSGMGALVVMFGFEFGSLAMEQSMGPQEASAVTLEAGPVGYGNTDYRVTVDTELRLTNHGAEPLHYTEVRLMTRGAGWTGEMLLLGGGGTLAPGESLTRRVSFLGTPRWNRVWLSLLDSAGETVAHSRLLLPDRDQETTKKSGVTRPPPAPRRAAV